MNAPIACPGCRRNAWEASRTIDSTLMLVCPCGCFIDAPMSEDQKERWGLTDQEYSATTMTAGFARPTRLAP